MITNASVAANIGKIAAEVAAMIAEHRQHGTPFCDHALHCVVLRLEGQAEVLARDLVD